MYQRLVAGIRWFRIHVSRLEGKAKLSQNQPLQRQQQVAAHLAQLDDAGSKAIALAMARVQAGKTPWDAQPR